MTRETQTRQRFTWSIEKLGNRAAYSFVVAILMFAAIRNEALALTVGLIVFLLLTAIVAIGRRNHPGSDRQP